MENKEKKKYGGCLSIILPLWIVGQIITMNSNLTYAKYYTCLPIFPVILIGNNIIGLIGLILLLNYKKTGFYLIVLTLILNFFIGVFFRDYVDEHTISKSILGLGLFLLLMSFKNKKTNLNGYQTLGIFKPHTNRKSFITPEKESDDIEEANSRNDIADNDIIKKEEAVTNKVENLNTLYESSKERKPKLDISNHGTEYHHESPSTEKKIIFVIISSLIVISMAISLVFISRNHRTSQDSLYNKEDTLCNIDTTTDDREQYIEDNEEELNQIKDFVSEIDRNAPIDWGYGLTCTSVKFDGEYVCYQINTDETYMTIPLLQSAKDDSRIMEARLINNLNNTKDARFFLFLKQLQQNNIGIKYTFWSNATSETVMFVLSPSTLRTCIKDQL